MRLLGWNKKGQNVIEYLVLVAAVVVILVVALARNGPFARAVDRMISSPTNMIIDRNQEIVIQRVP